MAGSEENERGLEGPPTAVLDRLAARLGPVTAAPQPLHGGITNRNFRVRFGQRDCVLRLPGRDTALLGIDRRAERIATERAAALGIAPPLVAADEDCLVTEYLAGGPIDPARLRADPASAARALRAFHDSGLELPARFWVPELLAQYAEVVGRRGGDLPGEYAMAQALVDHIAAALPLIDPAPCHDDLLPGNILAADDAPGEAVLVDWEYAGMGHRMFDLANLAVNNELDEAAQDRLLAAYFDEPPTAGRRAALRLMMVVSDAREAAWGVVQGVISELDFDFGAYADMHFARLTRNAGDPRLEEWIDGATA